VIEVTIAPAVNGYIVLYDDGEVVRRHVFATIESAFRFIREHFEGDQDGEKRDE